MWRGKLYDSLREEQSEPQEEEEEEGKNEGEQWWMWDSLEEFGGEILRGRP